MKSYADGSSDVRNGTTDDPSGDADLLRGFDSEAASIHGSCNASAAVGRSLTSKVRSLLQNAFALGSSSQVIGHAMLSIGILSGHSMHRRSFL